MTVERIDEESPLLTNETNNYTDHIQKRRRTTPTPLPKVQISILMLLQICEPITSQSIYPYINQLISELDITGGDERKVGYYAGLIESLFFVTEAMTVFQVEPHAAHFFPDFRAKYQRLHSGVAPQITLVESPFCSSA